jgi:hypothetical protein
MKQYEIFILNTAFFINVFTKITNVKRLFSQR